MLRCKCNCKKACEGELKCKHNNKRTYNSANVAVKRRVNVQICQEKGVFRRRNMCKKTSRRAKKLNIKDDLQCKIKEIKRNIKDKKTSHCAKMSRKRRLQAQK